MEHDLAIEIYGPFGVLIPSLSMSVGGKYKESEWLHGINKEDGGELIKSEDSGCKKDLHLEWKMDLASLLIEEGALSCVVQNAKTETAAIRRHIELALCLPFSKCVLIYTCIQHTDLH